MLKKHTNTKTKSFILFFSLEEIMDVSHLLRITIGEREREREREREAYVSELFS